MPVACTENSACPPTDEVAFVGGVVIVTVEFAGSTIAPREAPGITTMFSSLTGGSAEGSTDWPGKTQPTAKLSSPASSFISASM